MASSSAGDVAVDQIMEEGDSHSSFDEQDDSNNEEEEEEENPGTQQQRKQRRTTVDGTTKVPKFVRIAHEMVSAPENAQVISFSKDGVLIELKDLKTFSKDVLPKYYRHSNVPSFTRQLNNYSFELKVSRPGVSHTFYNPNFRRGRDDLLVQVQRRLGLSTKKLKLDLEESAILAQTLQVTNSSLVQENQALRNENTHLKRLISEGMQTYKHAQATPATGEARLFAAEYQLGYQGAPKSYQYQPNAQPSSSSSSMYLNENAQMSSSTFATRSSSFIHQSQNEASSSMVVSDHSMPLTHPLQMVRDPMYIANEMTIRTMEGFVGPNDQLWPPVHDVGDHFFLNSDEEDGKITSPTRSAFVDGGQANVRQQAPNINQLDHTNSMQMANVFIPAPLPRAPQQQPYHYGMLPGQLMESDEQRQGRLQRQEQSGQVKPKHERR